MAVITSAFRGITTPLSDLYAQIHSRGWTVTKVDVKDGVFVASVKNPHGESIEKTGRDAQTALAAALTFILRREFIRQGAWTQHWADQLEPIAQAYAKAPTFDASAAGAWAELAADNMARAQALQQQLQVEIVDEPDPYSSPQELWKDVERNQKIKVTRANSEHPLWNEDQVLAHRLVHDVLGHAAAGGDFGWTGENLATAAHMPYLSPSAQAALFSETIGQAAYRNYYRGHGPRKITFLNEFLTPAQEENNAPGHGGEPVEHSLTPGPLPESRQAAFEPDFGGPQHVLNWAPGREGKGILAADGRVHTWQTNQGAPHHAEYRGASGLPGFHEGGAEFRMWPDGRTEIYGAKPRSMEPTYAEAIMAAEPRLKAKTYGDEFEGRWGRVAGLRRDPNAGYSTGIVPPSVNAVNSFGDPLDHMGIKDVAHKLDTGWSKFTTPDGKPDYARMKQAIINAFRAALMSPKKELRWNAVHYQDMMHIPHDVSDPKVYWEALENARINHNRNAGVPHPEVAHKAHYEALLDFYRYYQKLHPEMSPSEVKEHGDREVMVMQQEIEEKLIAEGKDQDQEILEPKVFKLLDKRLKQVVKDDPTRMLYSSADEDAAMALAPTTDKYGAFIGRYLTSIAKVSRYSDLLLEAALEDMKNHDGSGHNFRQAVLSLNIPYLGPKTTSLAWLFLQPLTSQLATVDTHICDLLGYKQADVANNRDYFRLERELQAGRDAAGYSHMPLGQFQWSIWDNKRNGEGQHQDHSALRPWNPQSHHTIDWKPQINLKNIKGEEYEPPDWWALTEPYRQNEVAKWNIDVAPFYTKKQIPWQNQTLEVPHIASASGEGNADELHISLDVPERIRKRIALWLADVDLTDVEPLEPDEYHITLAYSDHGVDDPVVQSATNRFNYTGLKFEGKRLTKFNNALVVELTCEHFDKYATALNDWLEEQGVDVSRYPDGYKPHITVGYTERDDVKATLPPLSFRAGRMNFSTPRPLRNTGRPLTASLAASPTKPILSVKERQELQLEIMRRKADKLGIESGTFMDHTRQAYLDKQAGKEPQTYLMQIGPEGNMWDTLTGAAVPQHVLDQLGTRQDTELDDESLWHEAANPDSYRPFDQQARGVQRLGPQDKRCHFHPDIEAVAHAGFYPMCEECLHSYQQAQISTAPDMREVSPQRLGSTESGYFFHTAPAYARESILKHGLNPQLRKKSPWSDLNRTREGFPQGTFLWEHPIFAKNYAHELGANQLELPDVKGRYMYDGPRHHGVDHFIDYGLTVDGRGAPLKINWSDPDDPEPDYDSPEWDAWSERRDNYEPDETPYNHKKDKDMLPQHLQGYDVWKVKLDNHNVMPDPEPLWKGTDQEGRYFDEDAVMTPEKMQEWWDNAADLDDMGEDAGPSRWMVTDPIHPANLSLHDHVPLISVAHGLENTDSPHYFENREQDEIHDPGLNTQYYTPEPMHRLPNRQLYNEWAQKWRQEFSSVRESAQAA